MFRVDASTEIGSGHVMRCLTLADELSDLGAKCEFICRPHKGDMIAVIEERGYSVIILPKGNIHEGKQGENSNAHAHWLGATLEQDAKDTIEALGKIVPDWLIVDHYALEARWERALSNACKRLMVIDDLADRPHVCDLLVDHGLEHTEANYNDLVAPHTRLLCGTEYALLRPEFSTMREESLARRHRPQLRRIIVSMGGVDKDNATGKVLAGLAENENLRTIELTVIIGPQAPWLDNVRQLCAAMPQPIRLLVDPIHMAELMRDADLAIGAAGTMSWERCCLGLPSIVCSIAKNQVGVASSLERAGAALAVHDLTESLAALGRHLAALTEPEALVVMATNAARITDGRGASRIAAQLLAGANDSIETKFAQIEWLATK